MAEWGYRGGQRWRCGGGDVEAKGMWRVEEGCGGWSRGCGGPKGMGVCGGEECGVPKGMGGGGGAMWRVEGRKGPKGMGGVEDGIQYAVNPTPN